MEKQKFTIKQRKDLLQALSGVLMIVLTFIANGFLSFLVVGFDFSKLGTSQYWANFVTLTASEMMVLFGMFIIQRIKDLEQSKITDLQKHIDGRRDTIYQLDKVTEAEEWLREIYNYRERLYLYEDKIKALHSKIILVEPKQDEKGYERKLKKYKELLSKRDYYIKQLEYIKKDKQRISLLISSKNGESDELIKLLIKELSCEEYGFKTANIHYRDVYWGNLLSDIDESKKRDNTPFFDEKKELAKNILKYIGWGLLSSSILSALMFPAFRGWSLATALSMLLNLLVLIWFMARGIALSHKIILGTYYKALEKRKSIYNQMLKDLNLSKIEVVEEVVSIKERDEKESN